MAKGVCSTDIHERIVQHYLHGESMKKICEIFNVPIYSMAYILHFRRRENTKNRGKNNRRPKLMSERTRETLFNICKTRRRTHYCRTVRSNWYKSFQRVLPTVNTQVGFAILQDKY